jgi:hypothetical protein
MRTKKPPKDERSEKNESTEGGLKAFQHKAM